MCRCEERVINLPISVIGFGYTMSSSDYFNFIKNKASDNTITIFKDGNKLGAKNKLFVQNKILSFINNVDNVDTNGIEKLLVECKCI